MESVLRRLRLKKGDGRDSEARKRLQKELFAFNTCSDHGFPSEPNAVAYDTKLNLFAVGTNDGAVKLYGKPGVYFCGQHKNNLAITKMCFLPDEARIITLCADNSMHLWELNVKEGGVSVLELVKSIEIENSKMKMVSSFCLTAAGDKLVLGTDGGNVHLFDIATFQLMETSLQQDILIQNAPEDFKVSPGSIEAVQQHPVTPDKFLIGYSRGLIVLWDFAASKAEHTYYAAQELESLRFNGDGSEFVSSHADGSYVVWTTSCSTKPKENPNTPYGPFPCKAITSIDWKQGKTDAWMVFAGGMPRASFGDRHTVSVTHGSTHVTFDFSSRVIDFVLLSEPSDAADVDPHTLLVLTSRELVAIDLSSDGWPVHCNPYVLSCSQSSRVTCMEQVGAVTESMWNNIAAMGNKRLELYSTKTWPITGGQLSEQSEQQQQRSLLITGHADGSVNFWDARVNGGLGLLYTLTTANSVFVFETVVADPVNAPLEEEWPPFRKVGSTLTPAVEDGRLAISRIVFCPISDTLLLGGAGGHVVVFKFESVEGSQNIEKSTIDVVVRRDDFVSTGAGPLTVKADVAWTGAGYQPKCVVQMTPAVPCTSLAFHADSQLIAVSTSYGIGVFDVVRMHTIYVNSVSLSTSLKISRSRSFQKTLRDSFRQLRRHRSYDVSDPKAAQKKETESKPEEEKAAEPKPEEAADKPAEVEKTETEAVVEKVDEKGEKATESPKIEEMSEKTVEGKEEKAAVTEGDKMEDVKDKEPQKEQQDIVIEDVTKQETPVEATTDKPAEGETATATVPETPAKEKKHVKEETPLVMTNIESLCFADTFVLHGQPQCCTLWVGTNSGHVYVYRMVLPDAEKRQEEEVKCTLVKEIRLKHGAPVVAMFVVDRNLRPLAAGLTTEPTSTEGDAATPATPVHTGGHRLIVCSQQQVKIFSLPNLKAQGKFKLSLHGEDVRFTAAQLATFVSKSDEGYNEADLVCLTSQDKLSVLSLPHLRRQLETDAIVIKKQSSDVVPSVILTTSGTVFYCVGSELSEFSVSARPLAPCCSVELKDGMRPVPVVEEPAAEEAAPAAEEVAPTVATESVTQEVAAAAVVTEASKPSTDEPAVSAAEPKMIDDSIVSANDSMAAGDVTADSIKVHEHVAVSSRDESSSGDVISSHKVIETTVHSMKTIGSSVSESTTTTVEEVKKVEGMMSVCTVSSSTVTTSGTSSAVVVAEGN